MHEETEGVDRELWEEGLKSFCREMAVSVAAMRGMADAMANGVTQANYFWRNAT